MAKMSAADIRGLFGPRELMCDHTPAVLSKDNYFYRGYTEDVYFSISTMLCRVNSNSSWCVCECHGEIPGFENPENHEQIYNSQRNLKIREIALRFNNLRIQLQNEHQRLVWGLANLHWKKSIQEIHVMWHELNEEMRVIYYEKKGEGWEPIYKQMHLLSKVMWENNILRPDPVDGFVMGILNV